MGFGGWVEVCKKLDLLTWRQTPSGHGGNGGGEERRAQTPAAIALHLG